MTVSATASTSAVISVSALMTQSSILTGSKISSATITISGVSTMSATSSTSSSPFSTNSLLSTFSAQISLSPILTSSHSRTSQISDTPSVSQSASIGTRTSVTTDTMLSSESSTGFASISAQVTKVPSASSLITSDTTMSEYSSVTGISTFSPLGDSTSATGSASVSQSSTRTSSVSKSSFPTRTLASQLSALSTGTIMTASAAGSVTVSNLISETPSSSVTRDQSSSVIETGSAITTNSPRAVVSASVIASSSNSGGLSRSSVFSSTQSSSAIFSRSISAKGSGSGREGSESGSGSGGVSGSAVSKVSETAGAMTASSVAVQTLIQTSTQTLTQALSQTSVYTSMQTQTPIVTPPTQTQVESLSTMGSASISVSASVSGSVSGSAFVTLTTVATSQKGASVAAVTDSTLLNGSTLPSAVTEGVNTHTVVQSTSVIPLQSPTYASSTFFSSNSVMLSAIASVSASPSQSFSSKSSADSVNIDPEQVSLTPSILASPIPTVSWVWNATKNGGINMPINGAPIAVIAPFINTVNQQGTSNKSLAEIAAQVVVCNSLLITASNITKTDAASILITRTAIATLLTDAINTVAVDNIAVNPVTIAAAADALVLFASVVPTTVVSSAALLLALPDAVNIDSRDALPVISSIASALVAVIASAAAPATAPGIALGAINASLIIPGVPTGGLDSSLRAPLLATFATIQSTAIAAAPADGSSPSFISTPLPIGAIADGSGASFCGAALAITSERLISGTAAALTAVPALNPCLSVGIGSRPITLPSTIVAAQLPPSVALSAAAVAQLAVLGGTKGVSLSITLWGISPFNETAGMFAATYAALPTVSDLEAIDTAALAAAKMVGRQRRRILTQTDTWAAVQAAVTTAGGLTSAQASSNALLALFPRPTRSSDLTPSRPLDSRVISIRASPPLPLSTILVTPVLVTVPLRDLSAVVYDVKSKAYTFDSGAGNFAQTIITVTCPLSPKTTTVSAFYVGSGNPTAVAIESVALISFGSVVGTLKSDAALDGSVAELSAPDGTSISSNTITTDSKGNATLPNANLVTKQSAYTYVLSTDCGVAFGRRTFVCGPGTERVSYQCPHAVTTPTCLLFDTATNVWSTDMCTVQSVTATSVDCACTRFGDVAVRFATLPQIQADVFASKELIISYRTGGVWWGAFAIAAACTILNCIGAFGSHQKDNAARYSKALETDVDIMALRASAVVACRVWTLDTVIPKLGSVLNTPLNNLRLQPSSSTAKVIPLGYLQSALSRNTRLAALHKAVLARAVLARGAIIETSELSPRSSVVANTTAIIRQGAIATALHIWRTSPVGALIKGNLPPVLAIASARAAATPSALFLSVWPLVLTAGRARLITVPLSALASPAYVRFLASAVAAVGGLAGTAVLASFIVQPPVAGALSVELPALQVDECFFLAFLSTVIIALPLNVMILMGLRAVAVFDAHWRYPELTRAAAMRTAFAVALEGAPTSQLIAAITAGVKENRIHLTEVEAMNLDEASLSRGNMQSVDIIRISQALSNMASFAPPEPPLYAYSRAAAMRDSALLIGLGIAAVYGFSFVLVRGVAIAQSVVIAWALGVLFFVISLRAIDFIYVWASFHAKDAIIATRQGHSSIDIVDAAALGSWMDLAAEPSAAAVAIGEAPDIVTAALVQMSVLASVWDSTVNDAALNVRTAALAAVYALAKADALRQATLKPPMHDDIDVMPPSPAPLEPSSPSLLPAADEVQPPHMNNFTSGAQFFHRNFLERSSTTNTNSSSSSSSSSSSRSEVDVSYTPVAIADSLVSTPGTVISIKPDDKTDDTIDSILYKGKFGMNAVAVVAPTPAPTGIGEFIPMKSRPVLPRLGLGGLRVGGGGGLNLKRTGNNVIGIKK